MRGLYLVETKYFAAGVIVNGGMVSYTAPIYRWMIGKPWNKVSKWQKITKITATGGQP